VTAHGFDTGVGGLITEHQAEAIVLDCSVLQMSESLFDLLRDDPDFERFPVVIVTDMPEKAVAGLRARQAKHVKLVPKPFTGSQVARALDEVLERG
jgi:CheY-like chemotaxis protein